MQPAKVDPKKKNYQGPKPAEALKELGNEFLDVPKQLFNEAGAQLGIKKPLSGEFKLTSGTQAPAEQPRVDNQEAKIRQLQHTQRQEREFFVSKQKNVDQQIQKLMQDLQVEVAKLQKQTSELGADIKKVTVETKPQKGGIYYLNFFDMMIVMLRDLRQKVGESRLWLNKSMQKKKQKGYWAMFKKHGMNFAASDERAVANSNG